MTGRVTVVGAGGFIGRRLVERLRASSRDVVALGRTDVVATPREPLGHVIYAAGLTADFRTRPFDTVDAHVCTLSRLLSEGAMTSITYLSSTRVYSNAVSTAEGQALEVNPNVPGDLYNLSKLMGESLCLHSGRVPAKIARLSNVVGQRPDPDIFIDQLLAEARACDGRVRLNTTMDSCKDYIDLDDAVDLLIRIAESDETGIFNVASGEATSNGELTSLMTRHLGFVFEVGEQASRWRFDPIDTRRVREQFQFRARSFAEYFPLFLDEYQRRNLIPPG